MKNKRIIIGLTGSFGSGCSTVADLLNKQGFQLFSISSILMREAVKKGIKLDKLPPEEKRSKLQDIGNELRKIDPGVLIKRALEKADLTKDIVINNIKNPGEIKELKRYYDSYVIAIDASFEKRVERILDDKYGGHKRQFVIDDARERDEGISHGQRLQECVDLADIIINNNDDTDTPKQKRSFKSKISSYVHLTKEPGCRRPTDIELWMNNAYSISLQSPCLKRQVGAVIVKKGYEVASGKNDVPPGEQPCQTEYEKECYRDILKEKIKYCPVCGEELNEDLNCKKIDCQYNKTKLMKLLDKCRSLHAEESAILQAAKLGGVSLENSEIYTTTFPCKLCANKIISVGVKEIIYVEAYPDADSVDFLERHPNKVKLTKFEGVKAGSFNKLFKKD